MHFKVISILIGATFKEKNIHSFNSNPLLRCGFLNFETNPTLQQLVFDDTVTNIQKGACPFIAFILCFIFWQILFLPPIAQNKNIRQI